MAFRTSLFTLILLIVTIVLYALCIWFPEVVHVEPSRDGVSAYVGLVRYVASRTNDTHSMDRKERDWVFEMDCHAVLADEDVQDCKAFKYASIAVGTLVVLSLVALICGFFHLVCGAGTSLTPFLVSFFMGFASLIVFMAVYTRLHIPLPDGADDPAKLASVVDRSLVTSKFNNTAGLSFGFVFYVYVAAIVFNFATILQHWATRSRGMFEEL